MGGDVVQWRRSGAEALKVIETVPGSTDAAIEQESDQAQLRILVNRQEVARYGINVKDVEEVVELAIAGRAVSTMFACERRFDITVRYAPASRERANSI